MSRYAFAEEWVVPATPEAVRHLLVDLERYPEWWPQIGAVASLGADEALVHCRSTLPYTLELMLHAVSRDLPLIEVALDGQLEGYARWRIEPVPAPAAEGDEAGPWSRMRFEQEVRVRGPLAAVSWPLRPLLRWNHARMMAGCHRGLLARLAGGAEDER